DENTFSPGGTLYYGLPQDDVQIEPAAFAYRSVPLFETVNSWVMTELARFDTVVPPCILLGKLTVQAVGPDACTKIKVMVSPGFKLLVESVRVGGGPTVAVHFTCWVFPLLISSAMLAETGLDCAFTAA